ncbi:hypothetical protein LIER_29296 [Lithospermum erythrorhizon]|uniref:Senescence regulator S40 n=1 Tax=Lithospermum erythrorhizon TaxID=34254 RepID=A0AAV3RMC1_LITER
MAEEFQESEVMFQEHFEDNQSQGQNCFPGNMNSREFRKAGKSKKTDKVASSSSLPVNIPDGNHWFQYVNSGFFDEDDGEMVPPHVITGQRTAGKMMAFSVCTGNGKTLKGRDLSQFRNSVLRMTGFLET